MGPERRGRAIYIVTSNEKNNLTPWQRRQDVVDIYAAKPAEPIVLWQEIRTADNHADITMKEPTGTQHLFPDLPIPISVPSRFEVVNSWSVQTKENTAPSDPPTTPPDGYNVGSAPRWYAVVELRDLDHTDRPNFYVINTHLTNGCDWNDKVTDDEVETAENAFLRPYWTAHWDLLKAEIDDIKGVKDATVFYGGDFNRKQSPAFGSAEKLAVGDGKIDKLAVIDRTLQTALVSTGTIATRSDHDAQWAKWNVSIRP